MADVFVSYASDDRKAIEPLARQLLAEGVTVFWDAHLVAGQTYRDVLAQELTAAKCVIVAWSKNSIHSRWVMDEAERGLELGCLLPISIDGSLPPLGFRQIQTAKMDGWRGDISDPRYIASSTTSTSRCMKMRSLRSWAATAPASQPS